MVKKIKELLIKHADLETALWNYNYMRQQFKFYGVGHLIRNEILKSIFKESKTITTKTLISIIFELAHGEYREELYTAIDLIIHNYQKFSYEEIKELSRLIEISPWWDSVDKIQKPFSLWMRMHPELLEKTVLYWNNKELFWYKRIAIIMQLRWKGNTNTNLLSHVILDNKNYDEFFVQKAIGWILREYSKTNPDWVYNFININSLSKLATKEASKYLKC